MQSFEPSVKRETVKINEFNTSGLAAHIHSMLRNACDTMSENASARIMITAVGR